jgi:hypothetical protein
MNYARYRSEFFSYLSRLLYNAHRWCEWQSLQLAMSLIERPKPIFDGPNYSDDLMAVGVMGFVSLDPAEPDIREAMIRGYTAPRQALTGESLTVDPNTLLWAGPNYNTDNFRDEGAIGENDSCNAEDC